MTTEQKPAVKKGAAAGCLFILAAAIGSCIAGGVCIDGHRTALGFSLWGVGSIVIFFGLFSIVGLSERGSK